MNSLLSIVSNAVPAGARGMATLKDLKLRIASTKNIQKITKSMKMIASTRLIKAQRGMEVARRYGETSAAFHKYAETSTPQGEKGLVIAVSSDKGLCGGIHSSVSRAVRGLVQKNDKLSILVLGDKSKAQLSRVFSRNIITSFSSLGTKQPTYEEASLIATTILEKPYDSVKIVFNTFKSAIAFETTVADVYSFQALSNSPKLSVYEVEDDVLQNFQEFTVANQIYHTLSEGYASEVAAKMSAMDNATRNAGDMIGRLSIVYNRTRQAAITTELVDIITGASAL